MKPISRRQCLSLAGAAAATAALPGIAGANPRATLGELGQRAGILFGSSIANEALEDAEYGRLYAQETKIVTTDWALKFDALRPRREAWNFKPADDILAFADRHKLLVRGHTLVWNENAPDWLRGLSSSEIIRVFEEHIDKVASRYAGRFHSWDVVNEPFWPDHGKQFGFRNGPWLEAMGPSYIRRAFNRVRAVDKTAVLTLNEAHCEMENSWGKGIRPRLLQLVDAMLDQGLPLQAVGLQAHLQPQVEYDDEAFETFVADLATRGVDIYITEMDVNDEAFPANIAQRDGKVAERYAEFLKRVLSVPRVKMLVTWQLSDRYSWYRGLALQKDPRTRRLPRPLLFDDNLKRKPAYEAVAQVFQRGDVTLAATRRDTVNVW